MIFTVAFFVCTTDKRESSHKNLRKKCQKHKKEVEKLPPPNEATQFTK